MLVFRGGRVAGASGSGLRAWLPIVACALPLTCLAQAARPPAAAASTPAKPASAASGSADAAAMERARRAAESPLRAILEAGKVRRRLDGDPPADPDAAPVVARPLVAPATPVVTIRTLPPDPPATSTPRQPALTTGQVAPLNGAQAALPDLSRPVVAMTPLTSASSSPPTSTAASGASSSASPGGPALRHMVEPETSPRLLEQLSRPEVAVEFTIGPDGTVSEVKVQPPVPRALVEKIVEAVEQWRYAPMPAPRRHRVQLVFKPPGG